MPEHWKLILTIAAIVQVADVWSTIVALRMGYGEGNPITRFIMRVFGRLGWPIVKSAIAGVCYALLYLEPDAKVLGVTIPNEALAIGVTAVMVGVVARSVRYIRAG